MDRILLEPIDDDLLEALILEAERWRRPGVASPRKKLAAQAVDHLIAEVALLCELARRGG